MKKELNAFNLTFRGLTREKLLAETGRLKIIITVNAELIVLANEIKRYREFINSN